MAKKQIIRHVCGNYIRIVIPLVRKAVSVTDRGVVETETPYNYLDKLKVEFSAGTRRIIKDAVVNGNVAIVEDNGTMPIGTYQICILFRDREKPMRYKKRTVLEVVENTEAGGVYDTDEFDVVAYYPVIRGMRSAVVIGDDDVSIIEGGKFGEDDTPGDEYADINATYGGGSVEIDEDFVTLNI